MTRNNNNNFFRFAFLKLALLMDSPPLIKNIT